MHNYCANLRSDKMKIQSKDIKRPKLIEPFFHTELLPDNSYVTYIKTSSQKSATSDSQGIIGPCKFSVKYVKKI